MPTTAEKQVSQLLGCTIEQLDITVDDFLAAEQRYQDVAKHLAEEGADIFVQGSFMLGTVVAPHGRSGEYDLDLVCRSDIAKTSITQTDLKARVGGYLAEYLEHAEPIDDDVPELDESRRCWTLAYNRFHMDVLPAIPDADSESATAILLTDKQLRLWQHSDPRAYVTWFRGQCARQFDLERKALAKAAAGMVDDVPEWRVRTPLYRIVQILKRHRDVHFGMSDGRTPSSLITTLAARSYYGETDLLHATLSVVQRMPSHIELRNGVYRVENRVCDVENFADKWNECPERRARFIRWLGQVEEDLEGAAREREGLPAVHARLGSAFGAEPVSKAVRLLADRTRRERENGGLRMTPGGVLTGGAGTAVRNHRFFGGRPPGRSVTIAQQALALCRRYPAAQRPAVPANRLRWEVLLQPTALSVTYTVRIDYVTGRRPKVAVLDPLLQSPEGRALPHVFSPDELCLYYGEEFNARTDLLANTVVPWTSEWLYFYEQWQTTRQWHGGGVHFEPVPSTRPRR